MIDFNNQYTSMQKSFYLHVKDPIYGSEDRQNKFIGNIHLFDGLKTKGKLALDFGCGLGRSIKLYSDKFKKIDGADINPDYIYKCEEVFPKNKFYILNGISLLGVPSDEYDIVFSTITLQHIPVWTIRYNILEEIYRVLKKGGWITAQMGYGVNESAKGYYEDYWEAKGTNSKCDVAINNPKQIKADLSIIGFKDFNYWITGHGPDDRHSNWIYFRAKK